LHNYTVYRNKCITIIRIALQEVREDLRILRLKKSQEYSLRNLISPHSNLTRASKKHKLLTSDAPLVNNLHHKIRFHQIQQPTLPPLPKRQSKSKEVYQKFNATIVIVNHTPRDPETGKTSSRKHTSSGSESQSNPGQNHQGPTHTTVHTKNNYFLHKKSQVNASGQSQRSA
jgi:hypothetical protein